MRQLIWVTLAAALALTACGKKEEAAAPPAPAPEPAAEATTTTTPGAPTTMAAVPNPYANLTFSDKQLQMGHDVFQKWCTPCHAPGPGHPGTQALAAKYPDGAVPSVLEERTDLDPDTLKGFVRTGVSIMPPFRKTEITDSELDALAAYIARPR